VRPDKMAHALTPRWRARHRSMPASTVRCSAPAATQRRRATSLPACRWPTACGSPRSAPARSATKLQSRPSAARATPGALLRGACARAMRTASAAHVRARVPRAEQASHVFADADLASPESALRMCVHVRCTVSCCAARSSTSPP
jgi:hypothetical protein